jgi:flagellar FliJ protein
MARTFRFRLEPVRQLREQAEDAAKEDLATAMAERRRQEELRAVAEQRLDGARDSSRVTAGAAIDISAIAAHQAFIERSEREAQAAELELHRHEAEVSARRSALEHAAQERQVLEKLRDKQSRAHSVAAEKAEAAMLDELATTGHRRRNAR